MSYQVRFTDTSKSITVEDQTINNNLSVSFVGKNYVNYAPVVAENFLHLLENFANSEAPTNPIQGQLWFDSTTGVNYLKIFNGIQWAAVGFIQKSTEEPINPNIGDLWINPTSSIKQLRMYTGSSDPALKWQLIGPANTTANTKISIEALYDNSAEPNVYEVIAFSFKDTVVGIISQYEFTPKSSIAGFDKILPGFNLNSLNDTAKFWGIASGAESLIINGSVIDSTKLLVADSVNTVTRQFNINTDDGLIIGSSSNLAVSVSGLDIHVDSTLNDSDIVFQTKQNNVVNTALYMDASGNIGIGNEPTKKLDVFGDVNIRGTLTIPDSLTINPNENIIDISADLAVKNITAEKITPSPILSSVQSGNQVNFAGNYIGKVETNSFLKGAWVGTATSVPLNSENFPQSEQLIMSVDSIGGVVINGWESNDSLILREIAQQQIGKLIRVDETLPYVYFYAVDTEVSPNYGCALYSVIVNRMGDMATFTLLSNGLCPNPTVYWKNITFFKISDDPEYKEIITDKINQVNQGWTL